MQVHLEARRQFEKLALAFCLVEEGSFLFVAVRYRLVVLEPLTASPVSASHLTIEVLGLKTNNNTSSFLHEFEG